MNFTGPSDDTIYSRPGETRLGDEGWAGGAPGTTSLVASHEASGLVVDTTHDLHADHHDPQHQEVNQNLRVALVPLALMVFGVLVFVAAAWTFLAAS